MDNGDRLYNHRNLIMKKLEAVGIASKQYESLTDARGNTYTTREDFFPPTPLAFAANPYNDLVISAKYVLDIGCGVGRNLPWVMTSTTAHYYGLDPNTSMLKYFWEIQDKNWQPRTTLATSFDEFPTDIKFDVVVSTFVFQHIGYRTNENQMNIDDITQEAMKRSKPGTIWILYEHDGEEQWIDRWFYNNKIEPDVYIRDFNGIPELTHRGPHHLIIWAQK